MHRHNLLHTSIVLAVAIAGATVTAQQQAVLPQRLDGQALWRLIDDLSEPTGEFPSDNLVSN